MKKYFFVPMLATMAILFLAATNTFTTKHTQATAGFKELLAAFPKGNLPYAININQIKMYLTQNNNVPKEYPSLSYELKKMLPNAKTAKFSRMPEQTVPMKMIETADNFILVYHQGYLSWGSGKFHITMFDKKGKIVREDYLADLDTENPTSGQINADLTLTRIKYALTWDKEVEKIVSVEKRQMTTTSLLTGAKAVAPATTVPQGTVKRAK